MGVDKIRLAAEGFLKLVDGLVGLAKVEIGETKVVVAFGSNRIDTNGFLKMTEGLVYLAFVENGITQVIVREIIVLRNGERMAEQRFIILPISKLLPRHCQTENDRR